MDFYAWNRISRNELQADWKYVRQAAIPQPSLLVLAFLFCFALLENSERRKTKVVRKDQTIRGCGTFISVRFYPLLSSKRASPPKRNSELKVCLSVCRTLRVVCLIFLEAVARNGVSIVSPAKKLWYKRKGTAYRKNCCAKSLFTWLARERRVSERGRELAPAL